MTKITTEHLARTACVYIRQSTADQLAHNHESRRRQYGLVDRAKQLGWSNVDVIDDDLGRSGGGIARPGFERLLATICDGRVGAVLAIEASRLARNGRDWHTLIEFCGLVGTLIVDEDEIYDPRHPNDRLLLGMKGTMSELEVSMFRQRSQEALKQKARRGALVLGVAAGYVKLGRDRIEKNPNKRVQDALGRREVGPCSACPSKSVAQISPSTVSSAMISVSVGPARRSMPTLQQLALGFGYISIARHSRAARTRLLSRRETHHCLRAGDDRYMRRSDHWIAPPRYIAAD